MSNKNTSAPKIHLIPVSNRTSDTMTVDDLLRSRAIAQALDEPSFIAKLDRELASIFATHGAVAAVMDVGPDVVH
jgi:hypothetical protein